MALKSISRRIQRVRDRLSHAGLGCGFADQALSSAGNFGANVAVARWASLSEFGAFGLAYMAYMLLLSLSRSFASEVILGRPQTSRSGTQDADPLATVVWSSFAGAAILVAGAMLSGAELRVFLFQAALGLPGLLVLDHLRYESFAEGRPVVALRIDGAWVALFVVGVGTLALAGLITPYAAAAAYFWTPTIIVASALIKRRVQLGSVRPYFDQYGRIGASYAVESLVTSGAGTLALYAIGAIAGLNAAGAFRAVQVVFGPVSVLFASAVPVISPILARIASSNPIRAQRVALKAALSLAGAAVFTGFIVMLIPGSLGQAVLGDSWSSARALAVAWTVLSAAAGFSTGALTYSRAIRAASTSRRIRFVTAGLGLVATSLGAFVAGAAGAAWGGAGANIFAARLWWSAIRTRSSDV